MSLTSLLDRSAVSLKAQLGKNPLLTDSLGLSTGLPQDMAAGSLQVSNKTESAEDEATVFLLSNLKYDFPSLLLYSPC